MLSPTSTVDQLNEEQREGSAPHPGLELSLKAEQIKRAEAEAALKAEQIRRQALELQIQELLQQTEQLKHQLQALQGAKPTSQKIEALEGELGGILGAKNVSSAPTGSSLSPAPSLVWMQQSISQPPAHVASGALQPAVASTNQASPAVKPADVAIPEVKDNSELEEIKVAAAAGNLIAHCRLGKYFESGRERNVQLAAEWYQMPAEQGVLEAQLALARLYGAIGSPRPSGVDPQKISFDWYRRAALQGDVQAMFKMGQLCPRPFHAPEKEDEGLRWYLQAANLGYIPAQNMLAQFYEQGGRVKKDPVAAAGWYRKAANQGDPTAQYFMGRCYQTGNGVEVADEDIAKDWYRKAAQQGIAQAKEALQYLEHRPAVKQDRATPF